MKHREGHFAGCEGLELYYQEWRPDDEPRAVVVVVHGVGEHCGNYMSLVRPLVDAGYAVCGYDQRGHGRSPGQRVHINRWAEYRDDLDACLHNVSSRLPDRPVILYGHSMGTVVVLDYLLEHPSAVSGAVISGAAIEPAGVGSPWTRFLAHMLSGTFPRFSARLPIDDRQFSRDPAVLAMYRSDPLSATVATARWGTEGEKAVGRVRECMSRIHTPLLILHGDADQVNLVEGARALYEEVSSTDKTLRIYAGAYHDLHNDLCHEQVAADVEEWLAHLLTHLPAR